MEIPVVPNGPRPFRSHQWKSTRDSRIRQPPMTKMSDTLCRQERLCKMCRLKLVYSKIKYKSEDIRLVFWFA